MVFPYADTGGQAQLWLRRWENLTPTPIPGTEGGTRPAISPDGEEVAFIAQNELKVAPLRGGVVRTLTGSAACCPAWGRDGYVYYSPVDRTISRVLATGGGAVEQITARDQEGDGPQGDFQILPGGEVAVFTVWGVPYRIEAIRLSTGERMVLTPGMHPYVTSTGHLIFGSLEGQILAAPFDAEDMELTGAPVPIVEGLVVSSADYPLYSVSETGTLVYWSGQAPSIELTPVWVERDGAATVIDPTWRVSGEPANTSLALSPDGARLAISMMDSERRHDLWVKQLDTGPAQRVTLEGTQNFKATWSTDGQFLTFLANRRGEYDVWRTRADGSGTAELVLDGDQPIIEALSSRDDAWLIYRGADANIYGVHSGVDSLPTPLVATAFTERYPALSPDGRWLAHVSDATGRDEVYVRPFPDVASAQWPVSTAGGSEPLWANSGRELFYRNGANDLVVVEISADPSFAVGQEEVLFSTADYLFSSADANVYARGYRQYDVAPDDQRFVMLRLVGATQDNQLIVIQNFFEELRQVVPDP